MKARFGYFLPDARVLCAKCHGPAPLLGRAGKTHSPEVQAQLELRDRRVTFAVRCDECRTLLTTERHDVDQLGWIRDRVLDTGLEAFLDQTGGMCVSFNLRFGDREDEGITVFMEDDDGTFSICIGTADADTGQTDFEEQACARNPAIAVDRTLALYERLMLETKEV